MLGRHTSKSHLAGDVKVDDFACQESVIVQFFFLKMLRCKPLSFSMVATFRNR